jgi:arylsulfatase A-like enzyme
MNRILLKFLIFIFTLITHHLNAQQRPNIVVFLVDDMGWMDTSVPFGDSVMALNKRYHTPNMERLAKEGMKFTSAYAAPVCTPSRVSLLSGMNAARHMVTNWTSLARDTPSDFDSPENPLLTPKWNINGLSPTRGIPNTAVATPLPALLKNSGYYTIHVGKAHFASWGTPGASPYNMGYLVNIAGNVAGQPQSYLGEENYGNLPGKTGFDAVQNMTEYYGTNTFLTEALTLEALKTLEQPIKTKQPFFLYMAHYAVHLPMYADPRFVDEYLKKGLDSGQAKYASMIEGMDKSLGDLMDYLKKKNVVKPGSKTATPVIIEDFFPSILEIAGIKNPSLMQTVDGKSFVSLLKGQPNADPNRIFTWHYPNKWKVKELKQIDYMSAIRQGDWKLVYDMKTQKLELYNLKTDIGEMHDVAAQNKEKVKQLAKLLSDRFRSYGTLLPTYKATGKAVPMPDELAK